MREQTRNNLCSILLTLLLIGAPLLAETPADVVQNTGSAACVGMVSNFLNTLNNYWAIPSLSSIQRTDVLTPLLISQNGFQALPTSGNETLSYYIEESRYFSEGGKINIIAGGGAKLLLDTFPAMQLNSSVLMNISEAAASSCNTSKWSIGYVYASVVDGCNSLGCSAISFNTPAILGSGAGCSISLNDISAICADTSQTMSNIISGASINPSPTNPAGMAVYYHCLNASYEPVADSGGFRASVLSLTSSATLAAFCAAFQN